MKNAKRPPLDDIFAMMTGAFVRGVPSDLLKGDLLKSAQFRRGAFHFFFVLARQHAVLPVILLRAGNLLQAACDAMVIGQHQASRRNERRRASAGAD